MSEEEIEITPLQIANAINNLFLEKDDLFVKLERSKKEIERLNNIINKLEKFLDERSEFTNFGFVLDYLKELKEKENDREI